MRHHHERGRGGRDRLLPLRFGRSAARLSGLALLHSLALLLWGATASAQAAEVTGAEVTAELRYQAHGDCPSERAFRRGVTARTRKARFTTEPGAERQIEVVLVQQGTATSGQLRMLDRSGGAQSRREVSGDDCATVVDALALVTALAIDPAARLTPREVAPRAASPNAAPDEVPAREEGPAPQDVAIHRSVSSEGGADRGPAEGLPPGRWRGVFAAQGQAVSGLGGRFEGVLGMFGEAALDRRHWLSPAFRVAVSWMPPIEVRRGAGSGSFRRWGGQASGCPVAFRPVAAVQLRPCGGFEIGALSARGVDVDQSESSTTLWATALAAGRTQIFPLDWLLIEVQAEIGVPLVRPRYLIEPDATVVEMAPVFAVFGGAVGLRTP